MATILRWFLYFRIAFIAESLTLSKKVSLLEYLVMSRFCTLFEKKNHLESLQSQDPLWWVHDSQSN